MHQKTQLVIDEINKALSGYAKYFNIEETEILVDDQYVFSPLIGVTPRTDMDVEDGVIVGKTCQMIFEIREDCEILLIVGEDEEREITSENIFKSLYWDAVITDAA